MATKIQMPKAPKAPKSPMPISDIGVKDLAEQHLKGAIDRLGKLVEHQDPRIALEASQLIVRLARPRGWFDPWIPPSGSPWDIFKDFLGGGGRAG